MLLFFCWRCLHFSVWFCIVCLSPVSRQWFYPMVGDIMLFYHRVEPRTGCWEVSASVRPSVHTPLPYTPRGRAGALGALGSGAAAGGGAAVGGPSIFLTHILPHSVCVLFKILPCCIYPYYYMLCLHVIFVSNLHCRMCANLLCCLYQYPE